MPRPALEKIELRLIRLPVPEATTTPCPLWLRLLPLKAMMFPAPTAAPPTVLSDELLIRMPYCPLPTSSVPRRSVPMRLPCTRVWFESGLAIRMPCCWLPEMTFWESAAVPPMVHWGASRTTPLYRFPTVFDHTELVPIRLPRTTLPD